MPVLFELAKEINRLKASDIEAAGKLAFILVSLGEVLGIAQNSPEDFLQGSNDDSDDVAEIEALIKQRNDARANKDWTMADDARDKLAALNIILEDSAGGTTWRKG